MKDDIFILDLMYSVNDREFYMSGISFGGDKKKIKFNKKEFIEWCKTYEDDEQAWELSEYLKFYNIL